MKIKEIDEVKKKTVQRWPRVAIIILNWNGWKDTIECLESVFRNTYSNYQVIVVDNGSTDGSMEKIKAWAEGKQKVLTPESTHPLYNLSHPPIKKPIPYIYYTREEAERGGNFKLEEKITKEWQEQRKPNSKELNPTPSYLLIFIQTGENLGFAGGNNVAIRYALTKCSCGYIWLLNNDTVIDKDTLIEVVNLAEADKKIGMVGSKLLHYYEPKTIRSLDNGTVGWNRIDKWLHYGLKNKSFPTESIEVESIVGASLLVKKKVVKEVGLLDELYFMQYEETDWCIKTGRKGYKLFFCYKSKVWHKVGASSDRRLKKKFFFRRASLRIDVISYLMIGYYELRNEVYFKKKHFHGKFLIYFFINFLPKILRMAFGIILYNDNYKLKRMNLLLKACWDGLTNKMGKTIDPMEWRKNVKQA